METVDQFGFSEDKRNLRQLDDQIEDARAVAILDPPRPSAGESIDFGYELALVVRLALYRRRTTLLKRRRELVEADFCHAASPMKLLTYCPSGDREILFSRCRTGGRSRANSRTCHGRPGPASADWDVRCQPAAS